MRYAIRIVDLLLSILAGLLSPGLLAEEYPEAGAAKH